MDFALQLNEMTTAEKLALMELLWDDLCRTPEDLPSPAWHGEVLAAREQQLQSGQSRFLQLSEVRDQLRKATL